MISLRAIASIDTISAAAFIELLRRIDISLSSAEAAEAYDIAAFASPFAAAAD